MAGNAAGALKTRALRAGVSVDRLLAHEASGEHWCFRCRAFHHRAEFGNDSTRADGRDRSCRESRNRAARERYVASPKLRQPKSHRVLLTPEERSRRISEGKKGRPNGRLGVKHSLETRARISAIVRERTPKGEACHSYRDGKGAERLGLRHSFEYKRWRYDVYLRDDFTCRDCGDCRGGNLHAHHVKPFADYPELRFDVDNGVTLCDDCHRARHRSGNLG